MQTNKVQWWFTGFYGNPKTHHRIASWALLPHLNLGPGQPWYILGDFNKITRQDEKWGGRQ